jgi:hypothetical protein
MTEPAGEPLRAPHLVRFADQRTVGCELMRART